MFSGPTLLVILMLAILPFQAFAATTNTTSGVLATPTPNNSTYYSPSLSEKTATTSSLTSSFLSEKVTTTGSFSSSSLPDAKTASGNGIAGYIMNGIGVTTSIPPSVTSESLPSVFSQSSRISDSLSHKSSVLLSNVTQSLESLSITLNPSQTSTSRSQRVLSAPTNATRPSLSLTDISPISSSKVGPSLLSIKLISNTSFPTTTVGFNTSHPSAAAPFNLSSPLTTIVHNQTVIGPDYAQANLSDCGALLSIYSDAKYQWTYSLPVSSITTYTESELSTRTFTLDTVSTSIFVSDGISYGSLVTYIVSTSTYTNDYTLAVTSSIHQNWSYPFSPPCIMPKLDSQSCSSLQKEWYTKFNPPASHSLFPPDHSIGPGCTMGCVQCVIRGNNVEVLYWPVNTAPGQPNVTLTPTRTGLVRAEFRGHILTSPTIYLAYDTLTATNNCGQVGATYADGVLAIPLTETLSSHGWRARHRTQMPTLSFNFADLNEPMPLSIYQQQPDCWPNVTQNCPVVIPGNYNPSVNLPLAVRTLDPSWADCAEDWLGVFDPPKALQSVSDLTDVSPPAQTPTQTARPGTVPIFDGATATATADSPSAPTEEAAPPARVASNIGAALGAPTSSPDPSSGIDPAVDLAPTVIDPGVAQTIATIGTQPVVIVPGVSNAVAVGDSTLSQGGADATIAGSVISVGTAGLVASPVVAEQPAVTVTIPSRPNGGVQTIGSVGSQPIVIAPGVSNAIVVGDATLSAGGAGATIAGSIISVGTNGVIVSPVVAAEQPAMTFPITAVPADGLHPLVQFTSVGGNPVLLVPGQTGVVAIGGTTLFIGGSAATVSGVVASLGANGLVLVSAGQPPVTISIPAVPVAGASDPQITSIAGNPVFPVPGRTGAVVVAGQTLTVGGSATTISGVVVSLGSSGLVISSAGQAPVTVPITGALTGGNMGILITSIGSMTVFLAPSKSGAVVVAGKTLSVGGSAATISGVVISVGANGLVVASAGHAPITISLPKGTSLAYVSKTGNVGDFIMSGLGLGTSSISGVSTTSVSISETTEKTSATKGRTASLSTNTSQSTSAKSSSPARLVEIRCAVLAILLVLFTITLW